MAGRMTALLSVLVITLSTAVCAQPTQQTSQVLAAIQQLSRSPQYAATIQLITSNQVLLEKFTSSPLMAAAFADPTGIQYVLATFGSPIYKEVLSNSQTAQELAASPSLTNVLGTPAAEAPTKLGQLLSTAQLPASGNAAVDYQTLQAALSQITGSGVAPVPGPAPVRAPVRGPAPGTVNLRTGTLTTAGK